MLRTLPISVAILAFCVFVVVGGAQAASPSGAQSRPVRVVSLNLCTDQLAIALARPGQLASVTWLAADPGLSTVADAARRLHINHGNAEEILPLKPDLVLAGQYSARTTVALLRKLGYRVVMVPLATNFDHVKRNIRIVARALGTTARGEAVVARVERRLAALAPKPGERRPLAAIYQIAGYSAGRGTLADAILHAAGFRNLGRRLGLVGASIVPLETLLTQPFEVVVLPDGRATAPSLARQVLHHPALARRLARIHTVSLPRRYSTCGIPAAVDAVASLARVRARILAADDK